MHAHVSVSRALARLLSAATTGVAALLTGGPAVAADAPAAATQPAAGAASLEEITVTANKLSAQAAIDVPGAIQAISGDALQREGAAQFIDIAPKIAGLQIQDLGPGDKKYIIRGINSTGDATTGVYFDEAVISGSNANDGGGRQADLGLFDLERVEVLRGPQGTLYGASSMSGTIRFITKKPQLFSFGGYATGELSNTDNGGGNYNLNGALNLPIVEGKLAARAVGWTINNSGYIDQTRIPAGLLRGVNNERTEGGRVQLRCAPTHELDIVGALTVQSTHSDGSSRYTPPGVMSYGNAAAGLAPVPGGDLLNTDITRSPWDDRLQIYSLTSNYRFSSGTLTATVNEFDRKVDFNFDSTPILVSFGVPVPAETLEPQRRRVGSAEVRYASSLSGPVNLVVGGFGQHENTDFTVHVVRTNSLGELRGPFSPLNADDALLHPDTGNTYFGRLDTRVSKSYAGFGELTWAAVDKLTFIAGARYFHEILDAVQRTTHPFGGFGPGNTDPPPNHDTFSKATYKLNASYKFGPEVLLYATFSQGFRGGGLNPANLPFASGIPRGFGPDSLNNYELGAKGRLLGGVFEYDTAAYLIHWNDIQITEVDPTGAFPFVANAGDARVKGFEASIDTRPIEHLTLTLSGSYQDAVLTTDQPVIPGNKFTGREGDTVPNVPKFQGSFGVDYTAPLSSSLSGTVAADVSHRGDTHNQVRTDNPANVNLPSYTLVNLRAAITASGWTTTVFVRNLTDERAQIDAINSSQDPLALITVRPRTYGVSVTRAF